MIYIEQDNTDIPVEILEYIGKENVRVRAIIGWPFGADTPTARNRLIGRRSQNVIVVGRDKIKMVQDG